MDTLSRRNFLKFAGVSGLVISLPNCSLQYKSLQSKSLQLIMSHMSQEEYFTRFVGHLNGLKDSLVFRGYDWVLMEHPPIQEAIQRAVLEKGIVLYALLPLQVEKTYLDELAQQKQVHIARAETNMGGVMFFDYNGCAIWDPDRETLYEPEKDKGVIYRGGLFKGPGVTKKDIEFIAAKRKKIILRILTQS